MKYKVFLVEDEPLIRERIRNFFLEKDDIYDYTGDAPDGEMALPMITELKPDIVLTDIRMPFMDGLQLARYIRESLFWINIVILSGYDEFEYARQAVSIGVNDYLLKPVSRDDLFSSLGKITALIEEKRNREQDLDSLHERLSSAEALLRHRFFEEVIGSHIPIQEILDKAPGFSMNVLARKYIVCDIDLECHSSEASEVFSIQAQAADFLQNLRHAEWFFRTPTHLIILFMGEAEDELIDRVYGFSLGFKSEMEKVNPLTVSVGIGCIVDRLGLLCDSSLSARKARTFTIKGKIMGIGDLEGGEGLKEFCSASSGPLKDKLRFAEEDDLSRIIPDYPENISRDGILSIFNFLTNLGSEIGTIIAQGGEDPAIFPELSKSPSEVLEIAGNRNAYYDFSSAVLRILFRERGNQAGIPHGKIITEARKFIRENLANPSLTLQNVASHVAMSPNHFCTVFSQETGETFVAYLTRVRIEKASRLITETDNKLADIAYETGYNESHYFSYIFKKVTGFSPRDYRTACKR